MGNLLDSYFLTYLLTSLLIYFCIIRGHVPHFFLFSFSIIYFLPTSISREGLSTALVFKALQLDACSNIESNTLLEGFQSQGALKAAENGLLVNDLELPAFLCSSDLKSLRNVIAKQMDSASGVMMSGSGTSIYALVRSEETSPQISVVPIVENILQEFPNVLHFECEFLNKKDDIYTWY